jgi:hypothetical protein
MAVQHEFSNNFVYHLVTFYEYTQRVPAKIYESTILSLTENGKPVFLAIGRVASSVVGDYDSVAGEDLVEDFDNVGADDGDAAKLLDNAADIGAK